MKAAGIMLIKIFMENWNESLFFISNKPRMIARTSLRNTISVLRAVAQWSTMVKSILSLGMLSSPKRNFPSSRWPLLLTGRNSVSPCMIPRMIASIKDNQILRVPERSSMPQSDKLSKFVKALLIRLCIFWVVTYLLSDRLNLIKFLSSLFKFIHGYPLDILKIEFPLMAGRPRLWRLDGRTWCAGTF